MVMEAKNLQRVIDTYFDCQERKCFLQSGDELFKLGDYNNRLYYVASGELECFYQESPEEAPVKIFSAEKGAFIGVYSFFSERFVASSTVISKTDTELGWIDSSTAAVEPEKYGLLKEQFRLIILNELSRRQWRATKEAIEKERVLQQLHTAEQMTTLGELAAGISHELNNAVSILSSKTERLQTVILQLLDDINSENKQFLLQGLSHHQSLSSAEVRQRGRELEKEYKLEKPIARELARAIPMGKLPEQWLTHPEKALQFWGIGRDLYDMRVAAKHSVGIVRSVKQLGKSGNVSDESVDLNETINKALVLLQAELRDISVHFSPSVLPLLSASATELIQVWANIIKNSCDAVTKTVDPTITISTRVDQRFISVMIANNGPEIDEATRRKIFQPNFTTKKRGLSFGLGLGLSIVKRIITGYGGSIAVKSDEKKTIFRIKLPISSVNRPPDDN